MNFFASEGVPDAGAYQIGVVVIVLGFLANVIIGIINLVITAKRKPTLEGQFLQIEDHKESVQRTANEFKELWENAEKIWEAIAAGRENNAGLKATMEATRVQLHNLDTLLQRNLQKQIPQRRSSSESQQL